MIKDKSAKLRDITDGNWDGNDDTLSAIPLNSPNAGSLGRGGQYGMAEEADESFD